MQKSLSQFDYKYLKSTHEECEDLTVSQAFQDGIDIEVLKPVRVIYY
jgi:hypothetical protein